VVKVFGLAGFCIFAILENSLDLVRSTDGLQPLLRCPCIYVLSPTLLQSFRCRTEQYAMVLSCFRTSIPAGVEGNHKEGTKRSQQPDFGIDATGRQCGSSKHRNKRNPLIQFPLGTRTPWTLKSCCCAAKTSRPIQELLVQIDDHYRRRQLQGKTKPSTIMYL
jgi:hypothetical protein